MRDIGLSTVILNKKVFERKFKFPKIKTKEDFVMWLNISKNFNFYGPKFSLYYSFYLRTIAAKKVS